MKRIWVPSVIVLLLSACGSEPVMPEVGTPEPETEIPENVDQVAGTDTEAEEADGNSADLYAYFMEDGTTAKFKGEGNEYAAITLQTTYLPEGHIAVYEDNGGTVILRVYRLGDGQVELVKEEQEFYEEYTPTKEELQALEPISLYYKLPIEAGDEVKGMTVIQTDAQVETPYRNFDQAILLERTSEDGALLRSYFVEGFGEVKREFRMTEGDEEYIVTSSLESIQ
ncbi:hypothetical protein HU147_04860 [Planomicrobium chinense]|uniref:hypothetical protein n=1 Tax=Planococcus chinensis TaxID=272917 RepID=UPI001CC7C832|nr:hypothetical protein [Planococcus chinensis]MBZ5200545.1 hypothetical protein [Planococcus chinensis]